MDQVTIIIPGFYTHYKRNPHSDIQSNRYFVLDVVADTDTGELYVWYMSLYADPVKGIAVGDRFSRALKSWLKPVTVNGVTIPRYGKISDPYLLILLDTYVEDIMSPHLSMLLASFALLHPKSQN